MRSKFFLAAFSLLALSACTVAGSSDNDKGNYAIGKPLSESSAMSDTVGSDRTQIVMFDKTVRLVHEFNLGDMSVVKTLQVSNPQVPHSVLFDQATGMIADFSDGHVTIFDRNGLKNIDPVQMAGRPQSAAYEATHRYLAVYDDMNAVGIVQLDSNGAPTSSWTGGPLLQNDSTLSAGDLIDDGSLVLALNDGTIAKVDTAQTLIQQRWIFTSATTTLGRIKWVAPIHGFNDRVLVLTDAALSVVSLATGATLAQLTIPATQHIAFESKIKDAHIILQDSHQVVAVWTDGTSILQHALNLQTDLILSSRLCLAEDAWSLVTSSQQISWTYNETDKETKDRILRRYRLSDMKPSTKLALPDQAQLDVSAKYVFALYPTDPLGYGQRIGISDGSKATINMFNVGYIHE
jgi:hypothetical protein